MGCTAPCLSHHLCGCTSYIADPQHPHMAKWHHGVVIGETHAPTQCRVSINNPVGYTGSFQVVLTATPQTTLTLQYPKDCLGSVLFGSRVDGAAHLPAAPDVLRASSRVHAGLLQQARARQPMGVTRGQLSCIPNSKGAGAWQITISSSYAGFSPTYTALLALQQPLLSKAVSTRSSVQVRMISKSEMNRWATGIGNFMHPAQPVVQCESAEMQAQLMAHLPASDILEYSPDCAPVSPMKLGTAGPGGQKGINDHGLQDACVNLGTMLRAGKCKVVLMEEGPLLHGNLGEQALFQVVASAPDRREFNLPPTTHSAHKPATHAPEPPTTQPHHPHSCRWQLSTKDESQCL